MAADTRHLTGLGSYIRLGVRLLGLTGLLLLLVGAILTTLSGHGGAEGLSATILFATGIALVIVWIVYEGVGVTAQTGRKNAEGGNAVVQVGLAVALLVLVNGLSLTNFWRFDMTRDNQFTLPTEVVNKLRQLDPNKATDIIVYRTGGNESDDGGDALDAAADRKVVEKVNDLVERFREFGPQFKVIELNRKDEDFEDKLKNLTQDNEPLRKAIETAPGNSIVFHVNKKVERLGFSEFYLLDKTASRETRAEGDKTRSRITNLVLNPQGIEGFVDRIVSVGRPKPKIGLLTIHPLLSSRTTSKPVEQYTAMGLRAALQRNGFEVVDVLLKRFGENAAEPAADRLDEYKFDDLETKYATLTDDVAQAEERLDKLPKVAPETKKLLELADKAATPKEKITFLQAAAEQFQLFSSITITKESQVRAFSEAWPKIYPQMLENYKLTLADAKSELDKVRPAYLALVNDDRLLSERRQSDVKRKLAQYVDECDLLIVPRLTTVDLVEQDVIPASIFQMTADQSMVIRDFVSAGKPVLFAFGPNNVVPPRPGEPDPSSDAVEAILARLGIDLGTQTIITDVEKRAMSPRRSRGQLSEKGAEIPTLQLATSSTLRNNPIANSLRASLKSRSTNASKPDAVGKVDDATGAETPSESKPDKNFEFYDVKLSGYRPIYLAPSVTARQPVSPDIMFTVKACWNEDRPIPGRGYVPKFEPTKPNDPKVDTREQEHNGPFPVGVAVEVPVPAEWLVKTAKGKPDELQYKNAATAAAFLVGAWAPIGLPAFAETAMTLDPSQPLLPATVREKLPKVRVVALGHGGVFTGSTLNPATESLLLNSINWQLRQEERMPREQPPQQQWSYPRAHLTPAEQTWWWVAFLGMPALAIYFGVIVLQLRRLR